MPHFFCLHREYLFTAAIPGKERHGLACAVMEHRLAQLATRPVATEGSTEKKGMLQKLKKELHSAMRDVDEKKKSWQEHHTCHPCPTYHF